MTLPDEWKEHFDRLYERTYGVLIMAGVDEAQAVAIAKERVMATAQRMIDPDIVIID